MTYISFRAQKAPIVKETRERKFSTGSHSTKDSKTSSLLFHKSEPLSAQKKIELLKKRISTNIKNKTPEAIRAFCIKELRNISLIVDAKGDENTASSSITNNQESESDDTSELILLFTNRKSGIIGAKEVNRNAAKYTAILMEMYLLFPPDRTSQGRDAFTNKQLQNFDLILKASKHWYEDYTADIKVTINKNEISIGGIGNENLSIPYSNGSNQNLNYVTRQKKSLLSKGVKFLTGKNTTKHVIKDREESSQVVRHKELLLFQDLRKMIKAGNLSFEQLRDVIDQKESRLTKKQKDSLVETLLNKNYASFEQKISNKFFKTVEEFNRYVTEQALPKTKEAEIKQFHRQLKQEIQKDSRLSKAKPVKTSGDLPVSKLSTSPKKGTISGHKNLSNKSSVPEKLDTKSDILIKNVPSSEISRVNFHLLSQVQDRLNAYQKGEYNNDAVIKKILEHFGYKLSYNAQTKRIVVNKVIENIAYSMYSFSSLKKNSLHIDKELLSMCIECNIDDIQINKEDGKNQIFLGLTEITTKVINKDMNIKAFYADPAQIKLLRAKVAELIIDDSEKNRSRYIEYMNTELSVRPDLYNDPLLKDLKSKRASNIKRLKMTYVKPEDFTNTDFKNAVRVLIEDPDNKNKVFMNEVYAKKLCEYLGIDYSTYFELTENHFHVKGEPPEKIGNDGNCFFHALIQLFSNNTDLKKKIALKIPELL